MSNNQLTQHITDNYAWYVNVANKLTNNRDAARELIHDLYVHLLAVTAPESIEHTRAFVCKSLRNLFLQKQALGKNRIFKDYKQIEDAPVSVYFTTPYNNLERKRLRNAIIASTAANRKSDVILRKLILDGDSLEEIAKDLNANYETVKSHINVNKYAGRLDWLKNLL